MDRSDILECLREHESELHRRGVARVALFGSAARGETRADSDIDLMVELTPGAPIGVFEYAGIINYLSDLFPSRVDVANHAGLEPLIRPAVERDAVYAF
jgi:hypothetical protein